MDVFFFFFLGGGGGGGRLFEFKSFTKKGMAINATEKCGIVHPMFIVDCFVVEGISFHESRPIYDLWTN